MTPEAINKKALIPIWQSLVVGSRRPFESRKNFELPYTVYRNGLSGQENNRDVILAIAVVAALIVVIQSGIALKGLSPILAGGLLDTDDYMRLVRVTHLWQSGAWFDAVIPRIGPPVGLALHWTRPMDILLLAGAVPVSLFLDFQAALFWWGAIVSPVLLIASLCAIAWAAAPVVPRPGLPLVAFVFVAQPGVLSRFMVGRPDHHGLLILLLILSLGFALRVLANPERKFDAVAAGLIGALAIWVSIESLGAVAAVLATFGLCWVFGDRRLLRSLVFFSVALCAGLALALLVERGPASFLVVEIDKVSILHIVMFALNALSWWVLLAAEKRGWLGAGPTPRTIWAGVAMAISLFLFWSLFPQAFADPMGMGGDLYLRKHFANISEIRPLIDIAALQSDRWAKSAGDAILWIGIAVPAVPWIVYRLWCSRGAERRLWLLIAIASLAFVPLTLYQARWSSYAETVLVLPYADLAAAIVARVSARFSEQVLGVVRPLLVAAMCAWVFVPGAMAGTSEEDGGITKKGREKCPINRLSTVLNDPAGLGRNPKTVLALIDFGPEILYRTRHAVLSIPNHRPQPGFVASYRIMTATDDTLSRQLLADNRVDLVVICLDSSETWFYDIDESGRTLYQALSEGAPPAFLTPVPLPDEAGGFRLFAVRLDS